MRKRMQIAAMMILLTAFARAASAQSDDGGLDANQYGIAMAEQATADSQTFAQASMNAMDAAADAQTAAMQSMTDSQADATPAAPRLPSTPKPVLAPAGGKIVAGSVVTISDPDAAAAVFYTTDGAKPTLASTRYAGPIAIAGKEKVRALAFDVNEQPSGVVTKTFNVKS